MINIAIINPKFEHNLAGAVRSAACFGADKVIYTGNRVRFSDHLPREFRHKDYANIELIKQDYPINPELGIPVAVELITGAECLTNFEHPENALYIFGGEDQTLNTSILKQCHRFVRIPSKYCLNVVAAINVVLYDRISKQKI